MKRIFFMAFTILALTILGIQSASAQFPKIKLPKINEPKTQPTQSDTSQPTNSSVEQNRMQAPKTAPAVATEAMINKPSIQFFLQVHKGYKGDPETWSWTPVANFRVNAPISPGSAVSIDYSLPGKTWKFDCVPSDIGASNSWVGFRDCGQNPPDTEAVTYIGPVDFKINLKNELEGKSSTLLAGKFKVEKFHEGVVDLPKFKNNFIFYVNYDWAMPVAYIYDELVYNWEYPYPSNNQNVPNLSNSHLKAAFWFKGTNKAVSYSKYAGYLYYKGQMVAEAIPESAVCEVLNRPDSNQDSPDAYCRSVFDFQKAQVWDKDPSIHVAGYYYEMYKNPGEYEIKVLQNGKLARSAKFTMGTNYQITDTGIGKENTMGTLRVVVPALILGDQDGMWDKNSWRTDAFYGNPLKNFVLPQP